MFYVLFAVLLFYAWPTQWGGRTTYIVVRGTSMQPNFHTGDIVIARSTDDHRVGDILVYAVPDGETGAGKLIMHRLKEIRPDGTYVIQGDNRDTPDQFKVGPDNVVGEERIHIPHVGLLMGLMSQWWFLAGLIGLFAFVKLWPDDEEKVDEDEAHDEPADQAAVEQPVDDEAPMAGFEPPPRLSVVVRRARPQVIVDGDRLALARWPEARLETSRQWAVDAADRVAERFGTAVAVVVEADADLVDRPHAYVELVPEGGSVANAVQAHLADRVAGLTVLVVTDELSIADAVWAHDGSVMRCTSWLALGETVGAAIP